MTCTCLTYGLFLKVNIFFANEFVQASGSQDEVYCQCESFFLVLSGKIFVYKIT